MLLFLLVRKTMANNIPTNMKKTLLFKIIAIVLPFIFIFLAEVSLRVFKYGNNFDLFVESPLTLGYIVFNPHASEKYFPDKKFATFGNSEFFKKKKDANTLRFFVLGESTSIGYPYFHNASFHRWLLYRLMHTYPDKNFEIINLSLTAVNSYTIKGFAKEIIDYEPDAVLIYVGHNEYYGALGVGSTQSIGGSTELVDFILKLRTLKTVQLATDTYQKTAKLFHRNDIHSDATRMEMMVGKQQIPFQSELYKRGIDQFRTNMTETLSILNKNKIPVFFSNLIYNEKDLVPFISADVDDAKYPGFSTKYKLGLKALGKGDSLAAFDLLSDANHIFSGHAGCNYKLGQLKYAKGDFVQAKSYFVHAKEMDELRFRAPEELNKVIENLCNQFSNTHLVDTKTRFENFAENKILGENLLTDHVHPNLTGFALMSDAFYKSMKSEKMFPEAENEISLAQLKQEMPISEVDSLSGVFSIHNLKSHWPYNDPRYKYELPVRTIEERLADKLSRKKIEWLVANDSLYAYYMDNHQLGKAAKISEALVLENTQDPAFYEKAAMLNGELKNYDKALFYFKKSFGLAPTFEKAKYLFVIYLKIDKPTESIPFLYYAIENNTSGLNLNPIKTSVETIIQLQKKLSANSSDVAILFQIAETYLKINNRDGAKKYLDLVIKLDSKNPEALAMLKKLNPMDNHDRQ
jgi:tetratricopeptide (TPR) repeat protein